MSWYSVGQYLERHDVEVYRVNGQQVAALRRVFQRNAKSDRIDARVLARLPLVAPESLHRCYFPSGPQITLQRACREVARLKDWVIAGKNRMKRAGAERAAINMPLQGSASDIIKLAMVKLQSKLENEGLKGSILLQVHDELVFETPEDELDAIKDMVVQEMEGVYPLKVPLKVDISEGKSWRRTTLQATSSYFHRTRRPLARWLPRPCLWPF